jgi:hypothetical protein
MKRLPNGHELTPDRKRRIQEHFERGLDLSRSTVRRRVDHEPTGPSPRMSVRVTPALRDQLRREAAAKGITVASLMRQRLAR